MGLATMLYPLTKRTSTFVLAICVGTLAFERGFDSLCDGIWENNNKGKLWKDIKHKYEKTEEDL